MSGAEDSHFSMPFSMDDVTSKIAYAYAKQQVFVLLGLFSVVAGALLVVLEWPTHAGDSYLGLIDDVVLLLGGLGILSTVAVEKDLKRVNRHAMAVLAVVGLVQVVVLALSFSGILRIEDAGDLSDDLGVAAVIILALVAYPFPTRRGGGLYSPEKVRILSNARTLAFAAFAGAVAALGALPSSSEHAAASGMFMSPFSDEIGLLAVWGTGRCPLPGSGERPEARPLVERSGRSGTDRGDRRCRGRGPERGGPRGRHPQGARCALRTGHRVPVEPTPEQGEDHHRPAGLSPPCSRSRRGQTRDHSWWFVQSGPELGRT